MRELNRFFHLAWIGKGDLMFTILVLFLFFAMAGGLLFGMTGRIWQ
jgi:hypothetical protein